MHAVKKMYRVPFSTQPVIKLNSVASSYYVMVPFCYDFGTDVSTNKHRFGYFTMILFYDLDNNIKWKNVVVGFINILSKLMYVHNT